jgi:hypothetical protein
MYFPQKRQLRLHLNYITSKAPLRTKLNTQTPVVHNDLLLYKYYCNIVDNSASVCSFIPQDAPCGYKGDEGRYFNCYIPFPSWNTVEL